MENVGDAEFLPNAEALTSFSRRADAEIRPLGRDFWARLDLSEAKAEAIASLIKQREAVARLVKDALDQQLQTFGILYVIIFSLVLGVSYRLGSSDKFMLTLGANMVYYSFLMLLGLFYPLARKVKWRFSVAAFLFVMLWPFVHDRVLALVPPRVGLTLVAAVGIPTTLILINVTRTGRRLWGRLMEVRRRNRQANSNCEEFVQRAEKMFPVEGKRLLVMIRGMFLRSALRTAFLILTGKEYVDKKRSLLEFTKQQRFRDSMGRLSGAIWIPASLVYLILPQIPEVEMISSGALAVLPVYYCSMMIMNAVDDAREKALTDVAELIRPLAELV